VKKGFGAREAARLLVKLMSILGYEKYMAQGGDWGSVITSLMASFNSSRMVGLHLNLGPLATPFQKSVFATAKTVFMYLMPSWFLESDEVEHLNNQFSAIRKASRYFLEQSTQPQTLGYGLHDSPVGLAAWMTEKFYAWSDCKGDIENKFSKELMLRNIMLYWLTGTITSSMRFYFEYWHVEPSLMEEFSEFDVKVPTAFAIFPYEIMIPPKSSLGYFFPIARRTKMSRGGHFAALEEPQLLVDDLRAFCKDLLEPEKKEEL